mgnify:CR=1 FL=1
MRICLQRHIRITIFMSVSAMVSPYVGIIQIRLRVWAAQPTLSLLLQAPLLIDIILTYSPRNCKRLFVWPQFPKKTQNLLSPARKRGFAGKALSGEHRYGIAACPSSGRKQRCYCSPLAQSITVYFVPSDWESASPRFTLSATGGALAGSSKRAYFFRRSRTICYAN